MQDIQLISSGQLFPDSNTNSGGGGVVLDRRLRQTHLQNQALKCPRCDSLNTKFCYYNNYNLSQPRHFCKSCGRYWTKGGVLRNVPVGGGCRKSSKRSSSAAAKSSKCLDEVRSKSKSNNSNSSSESSSLTGTGNAAVIGGDKAAFATDPCSSAATPPSTETVSNSFSAVFGFGDAKYIFPQIRNPNFGSEVIAAAECGGVDSGGDGGGGFTDIGSFSSLNNETAARNFSTSSYDVVSPYGQYDRPYELWQLGSEERASGGGFVDPTIQIDQHHHQSSSLGSEPLSWHQEQKQQQEMFGLTSAVDQGYWSQQQWSNTDNAHLYLP